MLVKTCIVLLSLGFLFGQFTLPAFAQNQTTGSISGWVKDQNGALLAGADVTVTNKATGEKRNVVTNNEGSYGAPLLAPGIYSVRIGYGGFADAVFESVQVVVTETARLNAELAVAGPDARSVVSDPLINQDGPQLGRAVDSRAVSGLPLATRNFTQILALSPGTAVSLPDNTALGRNSQNVSVNGARVTQNSFEINGVDANNIGPAAGRTALA
jgi:Carboxypeptidase regulatory-like domain